MNELLGWYGYDSAKEPMQLPKVSRSNSGSNDSESDVRFFEGCGWCGKPIDETNSLTSSSAVFCSELCFSQSRRATFKKNKTCDWCKHVRHTVTYVDFQDGVSQLQFCSDKCLNQYKMHIFCRETRAHLEMHPHLIGDIDSTGGTLITPDLWLKNCKSPSVPLQNSPPHGTDTKTSPTHSNELSLMNNIIPFKPLLAQEKQKKIGKFSKKNKKCFPSTSTSNNFEDIPQDLRTRYTPPIEQDINKLKKNETFNNNKPTDSTINSSISQRSEQKEEKIEVNSSIFNSTVKSILNNILPPQTVFVPYPVILPLPIIMPIPIPIPKSIKINNDVLEIKNASTQTENLEENLTSKKYSNYPIKRTLRKRRRIVGEQRRKMIRTKKKLG